MKILKIKFKNINSLGGEHEIDFTQKPFTNSGLFAITGPTGSGKSTILDVICLALYNEMPRMERVSKSEMLKHGAILTKGKSDAYASVTYSCKKGVFQSVWSVRLARTGTLQDYEMFLYDSEGNPLNQKKTEVPPLNQDFIGLNYGQFVKSVMLAQGDFAKFLKVNKNERSALLEQITGTEIYRKLGIKAYEKFKNSKVKIEEWQKDLDKLDEKILSEEDRKSYENTLASLQTEIKKSKEEITYLNAQIEIKNRLQIEENRLKIFNDRIEKLNASLQHFQENEGVVLKKHQKTNEIAEELVQWQNTHNQLRKTIIETAEKQKKYSDLQQDKKYLITAVSTFIHLDVGEENLENQLKEFYDSVNKITEQIKEKRLEYKSLSEQIVFNLKDFSPLKINSATDTNNGKTKKIFGFTTR